jgi:hypothetical protein
MKTEAESGERDGKLAENDVAKGTVKVGGPIRKLARENSGIAETVRL